ncbi:MAG TPA: hypothetical protein VGR72_15065 [Candidatus Acidoferrales bacterium]|nr:hypothetical protein [Candidatus Acidoferrales bacterium]
MQNANMSDKKNANKRITQKALRAARALETIPHPGLKFLQKHHVFIAKVKRGELWALNHLSTAARAAVTPLFEMWPPTTPRQPKQVPGKPRPIQKSAKTLAAHATDLLQIVRDEWGKLPFYLDTRYVPLGGIPSAPGAKTIFDVARTLSLTAIPVTSMKFSPAYQQQLRDVIAKDGRGAMIRLFISDFINPALLNDYLTALMGVLGIMKSQTDILVDLEFRPEVVEVQQLGTSAISVLPSLDDWRTVTLAAGCFPQSISQLPHGSWRQVPRSDWIGWCHVKSQQEVRGSRVPTYGDYGIRCGGIPAEIPNRPDPNIRYSDKQNVLVRKEEKTDGKMKTICSSLTARPEFSGPTFSKGDAEIAARAAMPGSPNNGQAEQWIEWCTNHHLELTASQIQNLP